MSSLADYLEARVDRRGPDDCWPWLLTTFPKGYGAAKFDGKIGRSNRLVLEVKLGRPIKMGMLACHTCDNPPCCNPEHLYEGTYTQNNRDAYARGRHGRKDKHHRGILSECDIIKVRSLAMAGEIKQQEIADLFGVSQTTVTQIKTGRIHEDVI